MCLSCIWASGCWVSAGLWITLNRPSVAATTMCAALYCAAVPMRPCCAPVAHNLCYYSVAGNCGGCQYKSCKTAAVSTCHRERRCIQLSVVSCPRTYCTETNIAGNNPVFLFVCCLVPGGEYEENTEIWVLFQTGNNNTWQKHMTCVVTLTLHIATIICKGINWQTSSR